MLNAGNTISWGQIHSLNHKDLAPRPIQKWDWFSSQGKTTQQLYCNQRLHAQWLKDNGKRENVECRKGFRKSQDINQQRNYAGH